MVDTPDPQEIGCPRRVQYSFLPHQSHRHEYDLLLVIRKNWRKREFLRIHSTPRGYGDATRLHPQVAEEGHGLVVMNDDAAVPSREQVAVQPPDDRTQQSVLPVHGAESASATWNDKYAAPM